MGSLELIDRRLLDILQNDFPITSRPYQAIAGELDISVSEVMLRIGSLKEEGIIRRIGAIIDAGSLGYNSTLCACKMPEHKIDEFAQVVNDIPYITHNYVRDHEFNIWFTLTTPSIEERGRIILELEEEFHIIINSMPAEKVYKIKVSFGMEEASELR